MSNGVIVTGIGHIAIIRFEDPRSRNPLSRSVVEELHSIVDTTDAVLVFTGTDDAFAAGANLREIEQLTSDSAAEFGLLGQSLMSKIAAREMSVAAINGFCYGGGLDLALACRYRVASPGSTFCHPGAGIGIITGWSGTQRLPRLVGQCNALELFFTAEPIPAKRALDIGLVDEITEDVIGRSQQIITASEPPQNPSPQRRVW